jgi:2-haloacid dehalogenase
MTDLDLTKYKALSFDCYGTLIDWEAGIAAVLAPWAREQGLDLTDDELLLAYAGNEAAVERETPSALYPGVLATAFRRTGATLGRPVSDEWAQRLGGSVPDWPAFPDSPDALTRLDTTLPELGVERSELLHVAQSLFHDHVPAKREGLPSVWINRRHDRPGWGATPEPSDQWTYDLEFTSMGDFADAVDQAFADVPGTG